MRNLIDLHQSKLYAKTDFNTENIVYKVRFEILFSSRYNYVRTQAENVFCDYVTDFDVVGDSEFADKIHHVEYMFFGNGG